jgi:hypothetical protein
MLAQARRRVAAHRHTSSSINRWMRLAAIAALAAFVAACAPPPPAPLAGPDPANPYMRVPAVAYRSAVGPYESRRPVEPQPWQGQNDRLAPPASKP